MAKPPQPADAGPPATDQDTDQDEEGGGLDKRDIRRLLKYAQADPIAMALGIGEDGRPVIQLDRRRPPRAVLKQLLDEAGDLREPRFGTLAVSEDRRTATFTLNKQAGGLKRKLTVALKGTGITRVEIPQ